MGQLAFSELDVESLGPESVLARGRFRLTMPDGTKPTGLFTLIVRKFPDGWKIVHDHTSAEETPAHRKPARRSEVSRRVPGALGPSQASFVTSTGLRGRRPNDRRQRDARQKPADGMFDDLGQREVSRKSVPVPERHESS